MDMIVVEQIPIIKERLIEVAVKIDEKLSIVDGLVCTEESLKEVKAIRAEFNKDFAEIEKLRKAVKEQVLNPYNDFEKTYKECVSDKYNAADKTLKSKIESVTDELKTEKINIIRAYFNEYAESAHVREYADFDKQMANIFRLSDTETSLKRICRERIDSLASGIKAIEAQPEELRPEILVEFKKSLSATDAISVISARHKAIEEQMRQQKEREERQAMEIDTVAKVEAVISQPLAPPTVVIEEEPDPIKEVAFKVRAPLSKLKALKQWLIDGGYEFE